MYTDVNMSLIFLNVGGSMSFISFALKNPFRRKLRTLFVVIFLAIGLIAIIVSVTFSYYSTEFLDNTFNIGGYDIAITGESNLSMDELSKIKEINGVQSTVGVNYYKIKDLNNTELMFNSFFGKNLINNGKMEGIGDINLIEGTLLSETPQNQVLLTKETADKIGKKVGDMIIVDVSPIQTPGLNPANTTTAQNMPQQVKTDLKVAGSIDNIPRVNGIIQYKTAEKLLDNTSSLNFNTIFIKTQFGQFNQ
jgi:MacB-like periplasmic core domain